MLITIGTALFIVIVYMFFDPTLRDFVFAMFLSLYLLVFKIVTQFVFKKGVVSFATIAWKRIFFVGGAALFRRFWINFFKKNATEHVVKPLIPYAKEWIKEHMEDFKEHPLWLKFSESAIGVMIVGFVAYFVGFVAFIWKLLQNILTGKFQTFFLSIIGGITKFFGYIWSKIKPWLDVIIITAFLNFVEKIPFVRSIFHNTKKVKDKVVEKKDQVIQTAVHKPVNGMANVIKKSTEKKRLKRQANVA